MKKITKKRIVLKNKEKVEHVKNRCHSGDED